MIVAAAASLEPKSLTLQAVADRLGVDRKAISYYVAGREELLTLVAARALRAQLADLQFPAGGWREAIRFYAQRIGEALLLDASLSVHLVGMPAGIALGLSDHVLQELLDAGFSAEDAGRALTLVTGVVWEVAKGRLLTEHLGEHPSQTVMRQVLGELSSEALPALRAALVDSPPALEHRQEFDLDVVIFGLESWLLRHPLGEMRDGPSDPPVSETPQR